MVSVYFLDSSALVKRYVLQVYLLNNLGRTCLALPKSARHVMAMPLSIERIPASLARICLGEDRFICVSLWRRPAHCGRPSRGAECREPQPASVTKEGRSAEMQLPRSGPWFCIFSIIWGERAWHFSEVPGT